MFSSPHPVLWFPFFSFFIFFFVCNGVNQWPYTFKLAHNDIKNIKTSIVLKKVLTWQKHSVFCSTTYINDRVISGMKIECVFTYYSMGHLRDPPKVGVTSTSFQLVRILNLILLFKCWQYQRKRLWHIGTFDPQLLIKDTALIYSPHSPLLTGQSGYFPTATANHHLEHTN